MHFGHNFLDGTTPETHSSFASTQRCGCLRSQRTGGKSLLTVPHPSSRHRAKPTAFALSRNKAKTPLSSVSLDTTLVPATAKPTLQEEAEHTTNQLPEILCLRSGEAAASGNVSVNDDPGPIFWSRVHQMTQKVRKDTTKPFFFLTLSSS